MKTSPRFNKKITAIACIMAVLLSSSSAVLANKIAARPLTPQEIHDNHLPEGTHASGGLLVVGVDEPIYLSALVDAGTVVNGVTWSIESRPISVPTSTAEIQDSPLPMEMLIYSPGDREIFDVADRKLFVPDQDGKYLIQAVVDTDVGPLVLQETVVGAFYVGVGTMGGASPTYPQCALCHAEQAENYMGTGHASFFEEAVDGIKSSHYGSHCMDCHNLGGHAPEAQNGNFFNVADDVGWTFPAVLQPGNWDAMPLELKQKANIQCEHCHGAGSEHHGDIVGTDVSLSSGDCGQCHDEEPYHNRNRQWELSKHSVATRYPTGSERRLGCVKCHSGIGFIQEMDGIADDDKSFEYEAIVCAACHDPHNNMEDNHQLRSTAPVVFENGHVVEAGGNGLFCMNCHKARRDAEVYVQGNVSSHYGPHYGVQGDLFNGTNAIEYGKVMGGPSAHLYVGGDSCVNCHMQSISRDDPAVNMVGDHTFKMNWDPNGTPDDHHDDIPMTGMCADCHGPMDDFNMVFYDYNLDGMTEGVQTEVHHLLDSLAMLLPPYGEPTVIRDGDYPYTDAEKKALYNYMCVEEDHSFGIHNPDYITGILKASIEDLGDPLNSTLNGMNIPVGGKWFYSPWFGFYAPISSTDWAYHVDLGYLKLSESGDTIILYSDRTKKWYSTSKETWPILHDINMGEWIRVVGDGEDNTWYYRFATDEWVKM